MISQERLDKLKQYDDPQKFLDEFSCEANIIVNQHQKVFEDRARRFNEKHLKFLASVENQLKEQRKICSTSCKEWKRIAIEKREGGQTIFPFYLLVPTDFPDDPVDWLNVYSTIWYDPKSPKAVARNEFTCSPEDKLLRGYIILALLSNEQAKKRRETLVAPDILSTVEWQLTGITILKDRTYKVSSYWPEIRNVLISDLEAVDKDLTRLRPEETEQGIKDTKEKREDVIVPKPPESLQKLLWICRYGRRQWKLVLLAILILLFLKIFVLPKFDLFSEIYRLIKNIHF